MKRAIAGTVLFGASLGLTPRAAEAGDPPVVERVEVLQNHYLKEETLLFYVSTRPGDLYDERRLRTDFRRLWDTGFLDDLVLDVQDGPRGKVVRFTVQERKRIQIVDYRGSKALTRSAIEERLKEKEAVIRIDSFYDAAHVRRAERVIEAMLAEKGRHFAAVKHDAKPIGGAGMQVTFIVDDGLRTKVKEIEFVGNDVFSDGRLRGAMRKVKQAGFWNMSWLFGSAVYTDDKWNGSGADPGDAARLQDFYLNRGYVTAQIGTPRVSYFDGRAGLFLRKKPVKWARLEIPVTEGEQYRVGEVKFEGLTVFPEAAVRPVFKLKTGDVYDESRIRKGYERLRDHYGAQGYFQWTGITRRTPHRDRKVVDVTLAMDEDRRYYVGRITFVGNDRTRDKVIRREVYLNEGDVFNTELLKLSIRRVNQLGYFKPMEGPPELRPSAREDALDVTFKVEEQNRNQFTFGGGVSGLEGAFLNASFQTANFLGMGETFTTTAQVGARARVYQIGITEPYFLDRPITAGVDLYSRHIAIPSAQTSVAFIQGNTGFALTTGFPLSRFSRLFASYSYERIDIYGVDEEALATITTSLKAGRQYESRLTPSWIRNTVDNPYSPRSGSKYTAALQFVGHPLGGTTHYYRPMLEGIYYHPVGRRMALGLRAEGAYIRPFWSTKEIPYYQRVFLGGENQIRGYNVRTVSPVDSSGAALGGNKYVLFNAEYYLDVSTPLRFLLFFDAGQAYREGERVDWRTLRTSTGAEARFLMPVLNVPFRLIFAYNPNRDPFQPKGVFKFAVGTTF